MYNIVVNIEKAIENLTQQLDQIILEVQGISKKIKTVQEAVGADLK